MGGKLFHTTHESTDWTTAGFPHLAFETWVLRLDTRRRDTDGNARHKWCGGDASLLPG